MTPDEYCRNKVAPPGSTLHYGLLFLDERPRCHACAVFAFFREVAEVVHDCRDFGVARMKLDWWRSEIERTWRGEPRHPVTRAISVPAQPINLAPQLLLEGIDGAEMQLDHARFETPLELSQYCYLTHSSALLLAAGINAREDTGLQAFARELGLALGYADTVREVRQDAARGRTRIPAQTLDRFCVAPSELLAPTTSDALRELLAAQVASAVKHHRQALHWLPDRLRHRQLGNLTLGAIRMAELEEIARDGFRLMEHRISLTPLRKLWIAWRTSRRERRHYG